jgi:hypothetical protein
MVDIVRRTDARPSAVICASVRIGELVQELDRWIRPLVPLAR